MAELPGKGGSITFTDFQTSVKSWNIPGIATDLEEITDFADGAAGYKKYLATMKDWTATLEMNWDTANTAESGDEGALVLKLTAAIFYTGNAIIQTVGIIVPVGGIITMTANFQGNGAIVLTNP